MNNMKIINSQNFIKAFMQCNEGELAQLSSRDFEMEAKPIEIPSGFNKRKDFPNCCEWHSSVLKVTRKWFDDFPNCCENHKKLFNEKWFSKNSYNYVVDMIVNQLSFTEHIIEEHINNNDWFEAISEYIDYNYSSFGQLPDGFGVPVGLDRYLSLVTQFMDSTTFEIPNHKRTAIIDFIKEYNKPKVSNNSDINVLIATYKKWLKVFPFEISFFAKIKEHFHKKIPIIGEVQRKNRYSGIVKGKLITQDNLINILIQTTKDLLVKINIPELRKQGVITNIQANQLEFVEAELNTKTAEITKQFSKGELKYVKALKKWLNIHKEYFKEIAPLLITLPSQPINTPKNSNETKTSLNVPDWAIIFYYLDSSGGQKESKIQRIKEFIKANSIQTTENYFKKQYYKICRRIEQKENTKGGTLPPLPPERIEKILPQLKNNKKALQSAKYDMDYLTVEVSEYKENNN
jgi:hypothetical protein